VTHPRKTPFITTYGYHNTSISSPTSSLPSLLPHSNDPDPSNEPDPSNTLDPSKLPSFDPSNGLPFNPLDTIYNSGYELKTQFLHCCTRVNPTFAILAFGIGFSFSRLASKSSGRRRSWAWISMRLLERGIGFLVTRLKGRSGSCRGEGS
jgi:hypothetical protein